MAFFLTKEATQLLELAEKMERRGLLADSWALALV
tara:strand:- start:321 stop:425 length:105 start_codon:yes stop_codon:yes gene_type:complete